MECPACHGKKYVTGLFPVYARSVPRHKRKSCIQLPCPFCNKEGTVPDEVLQWQEDGKILKEKRMAKRLTLRKASKELKMDGSELSDMENGKIEPNMDITYQRIKIMKND